LKLSQSNDPIEYHGKTRIIVDTCDGSFYRLHEGGWKLKCPHIEDKIKFTGEVLKLTYPFQFQWKCGDCGEYGYK